MRAFGWRPGRATLSWEPIFARRPSRQKRVRQHVWFCSAYVSVSSGIPVWLFLYLSARPNSTFEPPPSKTEAITTMSALRRNARSSGIGIPCSSWGDFLMRLWPWSFLPCESPPLSRTPYHDTNCRTPLEHPQTLLCHRRPSIMFPGCPLCDCFFRSVFVISGQASPLRACVGLAAIHPFRRKIPRSGTTGATATRGSFRSRIPASPAGLAGRLRSSLLAARPTSGSPRSPTSMPPRCCTFGTRRCGRSLRWSGRPLLLCRSDAATRTELLQGHWRAVCRRRRSRC